MLFSHGFSVKLTKVLEIIDTMGIDAVEELVGSGLSVLGIAKTLNSGFIISGC